MQVSISGCRLYCQGQEDLEDSVAVVDAAD